jgi:serine/threonine protein kinase
VKLARDVSTGTVCAVKIHKVSEMNSDAQISLQKEVELLQNIPHKNIIKLLDYFDRSTVERKQGGEWVKHYDVFLVIVLEFGAGGEMIQHLMQGGPFSEPVARFYFRQMIEAIAHLHSNGIAHRDIKPDNILMDDHYNLRLADFGFAGSRTQHSDGKMHTYLGTQGYMAPEIFSL